MCKASLSLVKHLDNYQNIDLLKINMLQNLSFLTKYKLEFIWKSLKEVW